MRNRLVLALLLGSISLAACDGEDGRIPAEDFESFTRSWGAGPCIPEEDCAAFIELRADRTLRYDRFGETPVVVHEATVTAEELAGAIEVLTDPQLVALLDLDQPPCEPPTDIGESMTLVARGVEHSNSTTVCSDPPLVAARETLQALVDTYWPGPSTESAASRQSR
jgi:hypothetical protein